MEISLLYKEFLDSKGISIDTRSLKPGEFFFALRGANFNGNKFVNLALDLGAHCVVSDDPTLNNDNRVFFVKDSLETFQSLALFHRETLNIPIIAIGGSNGKTTTKELLHHILSLKFKVFSTPGNYNNHIGVPLSILRIPNDADLAIIEIGDDKPKEVEFLCKISKPTHGLITNVGMDHMEGFKSFEENIATKLELFEYLKSNNGLLFVDESDNNIPPKVMGVDKNTKFFNYEKAISNIYLEPYLSFTFNDQKVNTNLFGKYNLKNISSVYAIASFFEVPEKNILSGISSYKPKNMRSEVIQKNDNVIILDAYNANPSSMSAALESFAEVKGKSKVLILGDMLELGCLSDTEHAKVINTVMNLNFDKVFFVGTHFEKNKVDFDSFLYFKDVLGLSKYIKTHFLKKCMVLIKGSRSLKLESIVEFL